jgi:hypothetical protein
MNRIATLMGAALAALLTASVAAAAPAPPKKAEAAVPRRLADVSIHGVIEGPRVLFITAQSRPRYRDGLHRRYLPRALEAARRCSRPPVLSVRDPEEPEGGGPKP